MNSGHIKPLTSLRFFAAASIVVYHLGDAFKLYDAPVLANGVSFFFVLSGFILTYVYQDLSSGKASFYVARFSRLWPLHFVTFALAAVALPVASGLGGTVANLLLVQAWVPRPSYVFAYNGVSWSISAEVFFYICFPALLAVRRFSWFFAALVLFELALLLAVKTWWPVGSDLGQGFASITFILQNPVVRILEFAAGVGAAKLFLNDAYSAGKRSGTWLEVTTILLVLLTLFAKPDLQTLLNGIGFRAGSVWVSQSGSFWAFAILIFVFAHQAGSVSAFLSARPLVVLGEMSFAMYMVHQIIIKSLVYYRVHWSLGIPATACIAVATSLAFSWALWRFIEMPARRRILARYRAYRPSSGASEASASLR